MTDRYVVSMRPTGLGDRLICLCAAWIFARNTNRILIADWRHSRYAESRRGNLYSLCFVPRTHIANVPFLCDETFTESVLPYPRHPLIWNDEAQWQFPRCFLRPDPELISDTEKAIELIRSTRDVEARTVVFDGCISNGVVSWNDAFTFFSSLQPQPNVEKEVARFLKTSLRPEPWIGLHVRHGNGGDIMGHAPYWQSFESAIARCERAIGIARQKMGEQAQVLLSTDSIDVQNAILQNVSGVITRPKQYRESGAGELHLGDQTWAGRNDALVEMLLLAKCSALIRYPPGSFFSFYAAVLKPSSDPHPNTVFDLFRSADPTDDLSPALLL
jgi:hypothetical protein